MVFGQRERAEAEQRRRALQAQVEARGWTWHDAAPAPAQEICEASFRLARMTGPIWPIGLADVVNGVLDDRQFEAARLVGYAHNSTNSGSKFGDRKQTNVLWVQLPASLPEIRLVDSSGPGRDHGLRLPPLGQAGRWTVEGFVPAFATDLLQPEVLAWLDQLPPVNAVVIRAGVVLAYGMADLDTGTMATVATVLAGLMAAVPATTWGRTDALLAGTGVFPYQMRDGAGLVLTKRLVSRDWKGQGIAAAVPWQEAPDAPGMVTLSWRDADVWQVPAGTMPQSAGFSFTQDNGTGSPVYIPTVVESPTQPETPMHNNLQ
ncbi:hypothetical protein [Psychromicrobium xiongbiense]|uniref:hypothetical protein n=1 Tax=Psychromicrobium xiongbiense TaxID=3051184 RepID=UPI0025548E6B|nr:hypothetical protein [Psychromicrobium sp. YIM S02556]